MTDVAFTGNQGGMTQAQKDTFARVITYLRPGLFRHGDCIGSDEDAHNIVMGCHFLIAIHPPEDESKRAFCQGAHFVFPPAPYLVRNHDMVNLAEFLVATPSTAVEILRSGTWATIRYAKKLDRKITVITPDGSMLSEEDL